MSDGALRVGIAGAPRGGGFVAGVRAAEVEGAARLHSVYDPDHDAAERFGGEHGVAQVCRSFTELLDHCDVVVLGSPQHHHTPQAVEALERGVHVLSEVPAAVSVEQAQQLVGATRRSTARYMLAENYCYTRPNLVVGEMARAGVFGELYYGEGEYLHDMKSFHRTASGEPTWRYYWQVGRNGNTYPTHSLGPLLQWFDDRVTSVSCTGTGRHTDPEHEIDDTVLMLARTRRGALLRIRLDQLSNRPDLHDYYSLQGTRGAYEAARSSAQEPRVYVHEQSEDATWESLDRYADEYLPDRYKNPPAGAGHWGSDAWPVLEFVRAIRDDADTPIDVYAALDMSLPGVVSEASLAQHGAWLHVPDPRYLTAGIGVEPGAEAPLA